MSSHTRVVEAAGHMVNGSRGSRATVIEVGVKDFGGNLDSK